jgi:DNA-binding NarL/FixJ family response regulator
MTVLDGKPRLGVLICDDFQQIREVFRDVIAREPTLEVAGEAADGAAAISEARRLRPDVILLDLAMPNVTGLEALPELRRIVPDARIIVVSGFATAVVADQVRALGADGFVEKGADIDTIVSALIGEVALTD